MGLHIVKLGSGFLLSLHIPEINQLKSELTGPHQTKEREILPLQMGVGSARMGSRKKPPPNLVKRDQACQRPLAPIQGVAARKCFLYLRFELSFDIVHK